VCKGLKLTSFVYALSIKSLESGQSDLGLCLQLLKILSIQRNNLVHGWIPRAAPPHYGSPGCDGGGNLGFAHLSLWPSGAPAMRHTPHVTHIRDGRASKWTVGTGEKEKEEDEPGRMMADPAVAKAEAPAGTVARGRGGERSRSMSLSCRRRCRV
jgi:hypothetical protein